MHSRPLEYDDLIRVSDLGYELTRTHRSLWANIRSTRKSLEKDHDFASNLTIPDSNDDPSKIWHNLPQPEFDDTGFVGRDRELRDLKGALKGPYPVVTVVGEGGLGKTALALKACYDLLDDSECDFDAIVWTTAKATRLTIHEIEMIDGAISSSLGIIDAATEFLGKQPSATPSETLIMHLTHNKILLIIDNLETVIDKTLKELVSSMPKSGSKIILTTRIGMGAFDFPVPLLPLNIKDAANYFRITARAWAVSDLGNGSQDTINDYCHKLQYNALYIKWFIQSVRVGKRPTILLSDPSMFLTFCLQNVFNALGINAKALASTMSCITGFQSIPGLAFFTDMDSLSIQSALSSLISANLVAVERARTSEDEDKYSLSSLAVSYIQKYIRPSMLEQKKLIAKQHELRALKERFIANSQIDVFDMNYVCVRDEDDYVPAKYLTHAVNHIFKRRFSEALREITKAQDLSPNYFEVHRVMAFLYLSQEEYFSAKAEYEAAISLAPKQAPLRVWYGGLLSRWFNESEDGLKQLLEAEAFAPDSIIIKLECARTLQYLSRFDESAKRLRAVEENGIGRQSAKIRRVYIDLCLQNEIRQAVHLSSLQKCLEALECLEKARCIFEKAPSALIDQRTLRSLNHARGCFAAVRRGLRGLPEAKHLGEFEEWLSMKGLFNSSRSSISEIDGESEVSPAASIGSRGRLAQLHSSFGFIESTEGRYFFHKTNWIGEVDFKLLGEGAVVQFEIIVDGTRTRADRVSPVEVSDLASLRSKRLEGFVQSLTRFWGFIKLDSGGDLFFAKQNCADNTRFDELKRGDKVRCNINIDGKGRTHGDEVEQLSVSLD